MSRLALKLPPGATAATAQLRQRFEALAPREQRALRVAIAAALLLLAWSIAVRPAWHTVTEAPAAIDRVDAQLQAMQALAAEGRGLKNTPLVSTGQAALALRAATERLGDRARLLILGDHATLTLNGVEADALRAWLVEARSAARAHPIEAQMTRGPNGYTGTLTVALGTST